MKWLNAHVYRYQALTALFLPLLSLSRLVLHYVQHLRQTQRLT